MSEEIYSSIATAVMEGEEEEGRRLVEEALKSDLPPLDILQKGILQGITEAGELWKQNKYFLPDVVLAAEAFEAAMEPLEPRLKEEEDGRIGKGFVIGVVHGDMHDLGKRLVITMLSAAGFEVTDLGIDVPSEDFVQAVKDLKPAILGLGAYMTTTMLQMKKIIADLEKSGVREDVKLMVGGVPTSQAFADEVGADAWGKDALDATQKALALVGVRQDG
jgi:5-methyltetrahydrofolate--homocysteine methyltransferase